jgi:hypothetical protein
MAELSDPKPSETPAPSPCCTPEQQTTCCEPADKRDCCPPKSSACGC